MSAADAPPGDDATLGEAKAWLRDWLTDGASCPCCTQRAQVYRRPIYATMARALITLYRAGGAAHPVHLPTVLGRRTNGTGRTMAGGDEAKLAYWGLIAECTEPREDGGRAGWWQITEAGVRYLHGEPVPHYALVYDGRCLGLTGEPRTISDALGAEFDLGQLVGARPVEG